MVTHLFNAQSQLGNREPGVVGAALDRRPPLGRPDRRRHPRRCAASIGVALRAKRGPGHIFLVTDAMSPTGTGATELRAHRPHRLPQGRRAAPRRRHAGRRRPDDDRRRRYMHRTLGLPLEEALRMASLYPAQALGVAAERGRFATGSRADLVHLDDDLAVRRTWVGGR